MFVEEKLSFFFPDGLFSIQRRTSFCVRKIVIGGKKCDKENVIPITRTASKEQVSYFTMTFQHPDSIFVSQVEKEKKIRRDSEFPSRQEIQFDLP